MSFEAVFLGHSNNHNNFLLHGGSHHNMSLDQELQLLHDHFHFFGSQCVVVARFLAQWFFPLFFVVSQCVSAAMMQDAVDAVESWVLRTPILSQIAVMIAAGERSKTSNSNNQAMKKEEEDQSEALQDEQQSQQAEEKQQRSHQAKPVAPKHIAVIMDGNRRYGRTKLGSSLHGHRVGGERLRDFVRWCREAGVEMLTVYAFSTENWNRPQQEVDLLMDLFASFFEQMLKDAEEIGIRIRFMSSEPEKLPPQIRDLMERVELATRKHIGNSICVNVCASYGSRSAVLRAVKAQQQLQQINRSSDNADDDDAWLMRRLAVSFVEEKNDDGKLFCERDAELWAAPDVLIRTSGEVRLSNFMLLELAYSEMFFWDMTWPEVSREKLAECIDEFCKNRQRRMGK